MVAAVAIQKIVTDSTEAKLSDGLIKELHQLEIQQTKLEDQGSNTANNLADIREKNKYLK